MSTIVKLFMSGRSQAIRLPARLRLSASEVQIEQIGSALWVQPRTAPASDMGAWLQHFYASTEPLPDDFLLERRDAPPQQRDWS
ncbi:MAG: AbrB family transcriptional regulator [Rhodocyclaceae bacterium]|nr:AbrB family transcriptional regulator [Rhodocyclaceae bacterium]